MDPQVDPQNGPYEADLRGPLRNKGPSGSTQGPYGSIVLPRPLDNRKKT